MRYVSGACCAAVVICASGVWGMRNVGEIGILESKIDGVIKITERSQFLGMTHEQMRTVKSVVIEKQDIDLEFHEHWCTLFSSAPVFLEDVVFRDCNLLEDLGIPIPINYAVNLAIVNCGLVATQVELVLQELDPYYIRRIDFSHNRLGEDEKQFYKALCQYVGGGRMSLQELDLRWNGLKEQFPYNKENTNVLF
jgi:hypothetical protein